MNAIPPSILLWLQTPSPGGNIFTSLILPMLLMFGIFYFLLIRPQQKRQKLAQQEREKLLDALKPGDKVVTSSGILGTLVKVRDDKVELRIAQSVAIEMQRSAITGLQSSEVKEGESAK